MNSTRIWYTYIALGITLVAGCLYAQNSLGTNGSPSRETAEAVARGSAASLRRDAPADPLPEDTTDRAALPAEKVYKNIKSLKGMSAREFLGAMNFMTASLGVRCGFCHVQGDFASDDKPEKRTARSMIHMTGEINAANFGVANTVSCFTCHRGSSRPLAVPTIAQAPWVKFDQEEADELKSDSSTTAAAVLERYVRELGGRAALAKIASRSMKVTQSEGENSITVDVVQRAPDKLRHWSTSSDPKRGTSIAVYDGRAAWMMFGNRPAMKPDNAELEQLLRESEFFPAADLQSMFTSVQLLGRERVGDRDMYIVAATRDKSTDRLYFDAATGLLVRRYVEYRTPLGAIPFSCDYSDYREADGVKLPYVMKWTTPREGWTSTIKELHNNVAIADSMFAKPH